MSTGPQSVSHSPFLEFSRDDWSRLREATPLTLTEDDLTALQGINEHVSMQEVETVYLPISRLLNLYVLATQGLHDATARFLGNPVPRMPYVIAIAGSVAVGKSTTARILQALLSRWPDHPRVDLVTTDGFLYPNAVLEERGLMRRKGFPESYDVRTLVRFIRDVKSGCGAVSAPVYSHLSYDIVPGRMQVVEQPDILIFEGLNVLQRSARPDSATRVYVSDFFDFSIYVDAEESSVQQWFLDRFQRLRETAFRDPASFFHTYSAMPLDEALAIAEETWREINGVNLRENILPTRERAALILHKGPDHSVECVRLRKL